MAKNLVIVESPAKAKTISRYLGSDFDVKSSFGHIRDLPKKGLNIDIDNNFEPVYDISSDKKKVVAELKKAAKTSTVWLASDEDREGEAIAWHLAQALKLDEKTTKRIVFHEITKPAIEEAIKNPRTIDVKLVDAQQARRVLDRLVGYELSPVLWKKIRTGLSAGRVQSVAVRLIVEREREISNFQAETTFKVTASFTDTENNLNAELSTRFTSYEETKSWLEKTAESTYLVSGINKKAGSRSPSAPFTTSTLQQEASRKLGFSVRQTMTLAQRLYENGDITYMRTDSTTLSEFALTTAAAFIKENYGDKYHERRQYRTKNASAQEAHEAIRPTDFRNTSLKTTDGQTNKLYKLIWQRALASQMAKMQLETTEINIEVSGVPEKYIAKGEVVTFDGFTKVYGGLKEDELLPAVSQGQKLELVRAKAEETFSRPPARYSEASLVKKLETLGIGRPSTYAPTISVIQSRGYVEKGDVEGKERTYRVISMENGHISETSETSVTGADQNKLLPSPIAELTTDFLVKYFPDIVDYAFTANVEASFDHIANGNEDWHDMIKKFYAEFHPMVEKSADISRQEVSKARLLGNDPKTGEPIYARFGRFGPMIQRGETDDESKKPDFAPMPAKTTLETVTLEDALVMLKLPRTVGTTENGEEIKANIGRFGPYIQVGKLFVSIKGKDPHTITEEEAREAYKEKLEKESKKLIKAYDNGIKVQNGPYGPYVTDGKKNARLSKDVNIEELTQEQAKEILDTAKTKKPFRRRTKTKSA